MALREKDNKDNADFRKETEDIVKTWSSEILNQIFNLAATKKLPENIILNGVGMTTSFQNGEKITVSFSFGVIKGGKA